MLWEDSFSFRELVIPDRHTVEHETEGVVREAGCHPDWRYRLTPMEDAVRNGRPWAGVKTRSLVSPANR
jgi:hypothetical protein